MRPSGVTVLLGSGWAVLVLAGAALARPRATRVGDLRDVPAPAGGLVLMGLEQLGRGVLRVSAIVRRRPAADLAPEAARRLGTHCAAVVALGAVSVRAALVAAVLARVGPPLQARRVERRRLEGLEADLPEVVDLLALAIGAGLNVSLAVAAVGRRGAGPLAAELARCSEEAARGRRLADALEGLPVRAGEAVRPLVAALVAGERYGAPLGQGFERLSAETRSDQRRRCETAARRVPVTLLFPLVTCILPAFALLTVAPLIAGGLGSLRL